MHSNTRKMYSQSDWGQSLHSNCVAKVRCWKRLAVSIELLNKIMSTLAFESGGLLNWSPFFPCVSHILCFILEVDSPVNREDRLRQFEVFPYVLT